MTIQVKVIQDVTPIPVTVNDDCNHGGAVDYITLESNAERFEDGNIYPYYDEDKALVCRNCDMYFNNTLGCWDVL